jgi:hypothetical protein
MAGDELLVFVYATSYGIPNFRLENTRRMIFCFPHIVMMAMTCKGWMPIFLMRMMVQVKKL